MRGNGYGAKKRRTKNEENQTWNKETKQIIPDHKDASSGSELEKREMISKAASLKDRGQKAGGEKILTGYQSCCLFCPLLDKALNHVPCASIRRCSQTTTYLEKKKSWAHKDVLKHCTYFIIMIYITKCVTTIDILTCNFHFQPIHHCELLSR